MNLLIASGNTFKFKDWLKKKGFKWNPNNKTWEKKTLSNDEILNITTFAHEKFDILVKEYKDEKKEEENYFILSPSELDYLPKKCRRCYYLSKKHNIKTKNFPPPVFSRFDIFQKKYFIDKSTSYLTDKIPSGTFFLQNELPSKVKSSPLKDNKNRLFVIRGIPDLVIKFDNGEFGIIDFKTTKYSTSKSDDYRFQLEAYAQIFENPCNNNNQESNTPNLSPISHLGVLQFDPNEIISSSKNECNMVLKMGYSPIIKRNTSEFFERITYILDILESNIIPEHEESCNDCNFFLKQLELDKLLLN